MAKLHELLAVQDTTKKQAEKCLTELAHTFEKKENHFAKRIVTYKPLADGAQETQETQLDLTTTVPRELGWISGILTPAIDIAYQIDEGNMVARADLIVDEKILVKGLPVTALMRLEHQVDEIFKLASKIKTLDPSHGFTLDPEQGDGIYISRPDRRERTEKKRTVLTLAPATDKHAAQVQVYDDSVIVGHTTTIHWSGLLTVAQKGELLERIEKLRNGIKAARARGNMEEVDKAKKIAQPILDYVFTL